MPFESFGGSNERDLENRARIKTVDSILKDNEQRPKLDNFKSIYGDEVVKKDTELAAGLKKRFEQRYEGDGEKRMGQRFSAAFERVFKQWAGRLGWFGENSEIIPTSEYDDYVNGVDGVLVLNEEKKGSEYVALAIDTTHAGGDKIEEKMIRALDHITGKTKPVIVKYFERKNFRGQLTNSIPVIIGLDNQDANQIIDTFGQILNLLKQSKRTPRQDEILKEKLEMLKSHPAQAVFLKEIHLQLDMYQRLLADADPNDERLTATKNHVDNIMRLISAIAKERADIELGELENDSVLRTITEFCQSQR